MEGLGGAIALTVYATYPNPYFHVGPVPAATIA